MTLHLGDCVDVMRGMAENSVDAVVCDPPYGLSFMGKKWDYDVPSEDAWRECLRVLKPGAHLLSFAGTRTHHRLACGIEDAGFEIRDMIAWVYGSGFPKSLDVSKAIDKAAGGKREVVGQRTSAYGTDTATGGRASRKKGGAGLWVGKEAKSVPLTGGAPATDEAKRWHGWGTALKPALEPVCVARKPLTGTVAANVTEWGTGGLNVDGCRIATTDDLSNHVTDSVAPTQFAGGTKRTETHAAGRWPANLIHDGSDEVTRGFPVTHGAGNVRPQRQTKTSSIFLGKNNADGVNPNYHNNKGGSVARFFYCAKASKRERGENNGHPTVKPIALMQYLVRLVTPPGGVVLDPFMGSGSTGIACAKEGFDFIGIEREPEYYAIAEARIEHATAKPEQLELEAVV